MAKTLHIAVNDKVATYCQRDGVIVCGNSDYEIEFSFDSEWDNHPTKTARFIHGKTYEDVVFEGNVVAVPVMRGITSLSVGVFSGDLKTTTPALITCRKSILCDGGSPSAPAPDVYAQIMELLNQGGGGSVSIVQEAGDSETAVMSQKAVTEAHNALSDRIRTAEEKIDDIETGESQVGTTPVFEVDEVVTLEAGERAYVDIDSSDPAKPRISFGIPQGADGKSAYAYAVEGGYEGTEEDFARQMAVEIVYNDSLNLFDINDPEIVHGYYLSGDGYQGADAGCVITGYIPVEPNTKYTRSAGATIFHSFEYTEDKTKIGRVSATKTFTTSANAAYVRATVIITQTPLETYMFVKGDTLPSVYIPYGNSLIIAGHNIPLGEEVEESDSATITKWGVIGDSLSNQEKWQTTACGILRLTGYKKNAITGAYVADYGDSGDASANAFVNRYLNTPADCDLITIMGGTNDATYKCGDGIGELGTLNTNTFIGAYCTIIEGLLERNPAVRIMLFTPPRCYTAQGVLNPHLAAYVEAVKSIAERYDLPCLDLYNNLGINDKTFATLLPDYVHFSDALGYRVGRVIGNFVKSNY